MKRRTALVGAATALATAVAGCSSGGTNSDDEDGEPVEPADTSAGEQARQSLQVTVGEELAESEWQSISATYPRGRFTVESAQHEDIALGVDTSGDGTADEEFDASDISGVNNNDYSFTIELDTGYTLVEGDTILVEYPAVENPSEPGDYEVEVSISEVQTATATITIE